MMYDGWANGNGVETVASTALDGNHITLVHSVGNSGWLPAKNILLEREVKIVGKLHAKLMDGTSFLLLSPSKGVCRVIGVFSWST